MIDFIVTGASCLIGLIMRAIYELSLKISNTVEAR